MRLLKVWIDWYRHTFLSQTSWPGVDLTRGAQQFHFVGSIHMGTPAMTPLPAQLIQTLKTCDALIVEADITTPPKGLISVAESTQRFEERFSKSLIEQLLKRCDQCQLDPSALEKLPAWQIALSLQNRQAQLLGLFPEYGVDKQLIVAAKQANIPIIELEGADQQLALLIELKDQGLTLLEDTLTHWHTNARLLQIMMGWWLEGNRSMPDLSKHLPETFSRELSQTLLYQRNRHWATMLAKQPQGRYLVAVGALHIFGEQNLLQQLQDKTSI